MPILRKRNNLSFLRLDMLPRCFIVNLLLECLYYFLAVFILHYWGEILTVTLMGIFMNPNMAQSNAALLQAATVLIGSGLLKLV